jgi:hypothetical protein
MKMQWNKLWKARIGYEIDPEDAAIWESEIADEAKDVTAQEILDAVRTVADWKRIGKIEFKPGLDDMVAAIRDNRKTSDTSGDARNARVRLLCKRIKEAMPDNVKVWTIICENGNIAEMQGAEDWASNLKPKFVRPTTEEMGCKPFSEILRETMTGEMQEVSKETRTRQQGATS